MNDRCPYPDCFLEEDHDGDHQIGRPPIPRGTLRRTQEFIQREYITPPCDLHNIPQMLRARPALGMYIDMLGFGWQLCYQCVQRFGAVELFTGEVANAKEKSRKASRTPTPRRSQAAPAQSGVVVPFRSAR